MRTGGMQRACVFALAGSAVVAVGLTGCGAVPELDRYRPPAVATPPSATPPSATPSSATRPSATPSRAAPSRAATNAAPEAGPEAAAPTATGPLASDGRPGTARITIPALDIEDFRIRPHRGRPDDRRGTRIQDRGAMASPYGTGGLVGPGGIGNFLVTGHRTSSTRPFAELPQLRRGDKVHVDADGQRYTYVITGSRRTSFRSPRSLAKQSAAVPGRPGVRPTRAMITLSTCRTPEDRAEGNTWSDGFGNPEHRIDKIGVLVAIRSR